MFLLTDVCLASYRWNSIGTIWPRTRLDQVANDHVLLEAVLLDNCQYLSACACVCRNELHFHATICGSQPGVQVQPSKCSGAVCELTVNARGSHAMIRNSESDVCRSCWCSDKRLEPTTEHTQKGTKLKYRTLSQMSSKFKHYYFKIS
jgi:hypothetical protein